MGRLGFPVPKPQTANQATLAGFNSTQGATSRPEPQEDPEKAARAPLIRRIRREHIFWYITWALVVVTMIFWAFLIVGCMASPSNMDTLPNIHLIKIEIPECEAELRIAPYGACGLYSGNFKCMAVGYGTLPHDLALAIFPDLGDACYKAREHAAEIAVDIQATLVHRVPTGSAVFFIFGLITVSLYLPVYHHVWLVRMTTSKKKFRNISDWTEEKDRQEFNKWLMKWDKLLKHFRRCVKVFLFLSLITLAGSSLATWHSMIALSYAHEKLGSPLVLMDGSTLLIFHIITFLFATLVITAVLVLTSEDRLDNHYENCGNMKKRDPGYWRHDDKSYAPTEVKEAKYIGNAHLVPQSQPTAVKFTHPWAKKGPSRNPSVVSVQSGGVPPGYVVPKIDEKEYNGTVHPYSVVQVGVHRGTAR